MSGFYFWKNEDELWSVRKLATNHILLNFFQKDYYTFDNFLLPNIYPNLVKSHQETPTDILKEILEYEEIGISVGDVQPGPDFSQLLIAATSELSHSKFTENTIIFTADQLRELPDTAFSIMAPHVRFSLNLDKKKQCKAERNYLEKYVAGKFTVDMNGTPLLSYEFVEKFFEYFISKLVLLRGKSFQLELFGPKKNDGTRYKDQLLEAFSQFVPTEFEMWKSGEVTVRLLEHLLVWVVLKEKVIIKSFDIRTGENAFSKVILEIADRKPPTTSWFNKNKKTSKIHLIEILETPESSHKFYVYINKDYLRPFTFQKSTKTGEIIYALASSGSIEMKGRKKSYEYFSQYKYFKFFKQGKYEPGPLLDTQEIGDLYNGTTTYIIPHKNVEFKLISKSDVPAFQDS
jgi:hypothetical protein